MEDSPCKDGAERSSNPAILNYYRQFLIKADKTFFNNYQGLEKEIYKAVSRVFSGLSAILDFEIINFREYNCSTDTRLPNCQIVELFLTVDTSRKLQNGVNIDISIDSGMDILKDDVTAILGRVFDMKLKRNERHSAMTPEVISLRT